MFKKRKGKKTNTSVDDSGLYPGFGDDMFPYTGTDTGTDMGFGDDMFPSAGTDAGADIGFGDDMFPPAGSDDGSNMGFGDDIYPSVGFDAGAAMGFGDECEPNMGTAAGTGREKRKKRALKWIAAAIVLIVICGIIIFNSDDGHSRNSASVVVNVTKTPPARTKPTNTPPLRITSTPTQPIRITSTPTPSIRIAPTATPTVRITPTATPTTIVGTWLVTGGFRNSGTPAEVYYEIRSDGTLVNTYDGKTYTYRYRMDGSDRILIDYSDGNGYCHPNANGAIIIRGNEMIWSLASGQDASKDEYVWTKFQRV